MVLGNVLGTANRSQRHLHSIQVHYHTRSVFQISGRFIFFENNYPSTIQADCTYSIRAVGGKFFTHRFYREPNEDSTHIVILQPIRNLWILLDLLWKPIHRLILVLYINTSFKRLQVKSGGGHLPTPQPLHSQPPRYNPHLPILHHEEKGTLGDSQKQCIAHALVTEETISLVSLAPMHKSEPIAALDCDCSIFTKTQSFNPITLTISQPDNPNSIQSTNIKTQENYIYKITVPCTE